MLCPTNVNQIFLPSAYGMFIKNDHIFDYKRNFNKFRRLVARICSLFTPKLK